MIQTCIVSYFCILDNYLWKGVCRRGHFYFGLTVFVEEMMRVRNVGALVIILEAEEVEMLRRAKMI
jgi:hypothetical protein